MHRISLLVLLLFFVTGCSYVRPQQRLDFAPFAEHTISLAMDIEYGLTETTRSVTLRAYWRSAIRSLKDDALLFESVRDLDVLFLRKNPPLSDI